ncbi:hypothetical protein E2C01_050577 [Portunus trituberculatus]|uniref:Uncharacterized protein n=1 Tax=Portunus trituberculatus TaxID=210409 RepID=A0A5B7GGW5_PORTR|nr:hypothetical protein [Portunus trituberculatus]
MVTKSRRSPSQDGHQVMKVTKSIKSPISKGHKPQRITSHEGHQVTKSHKLKRPPFLKITKLKVTRSSSSSRSPGQSQTKWVTKLTRSLGTR